MHFPATFNEIISAHHEQQCTKYEACCLADYIGVHLILLHLYLPRGCEGHTSAVSVMACFGSAARGDPLYKVGVGIGRLLRTIFLADYFVNPAFRRELLRVLNRGEATNALKRLIYTGRVANYQAQSEDEMQAVADALSLLANIVMAWNTAKMQVRR